MDQDTLALDLQHSNSINQEPGLGLDTRCSEKGQLSLLCSREQPREN